MIKVTDASADHRAVTADLCGDITRIWKKKFKKNKPKNYKMSYQMTFKNKNEQKLQIELWIDIWKESFKKIKRKKINSYLYECPPPPPPPPFSSNLMECPISTLWLIFSHIWIQSFWIIVCAWNLIIERCKYRLQQLNFFILYFLNLT